MNAKFHRIDGVPEIYINDVYVTAEEVERIRNLPDPVPIKLKPARLRILPDEGKFEVDLKAQPEGEDFFKSLANADRKKDLKRVFTQEEE